MEKFEAPCTHARKVHLRLFRIGVFLALVYFALVALGCAFGENAGRISFTKAADGATTATAAGATGKEAATGLIVVGGAVAGGALGLAATGGSPIGAVLGAGGGGATGAAIR